MGSLIDSSVLIALERGKLRAADLGANENEPVLLSAVTASELLHGVHRADAGRRIRREAFIEGLLAEAKVIPFDLRVARVHARVSAALASQGTPIGPHDLLVASTALAHGLKIITANPREFRKVPGLEVIAL